jgi:hypothetical protein
LKGPTFARWLYAAGEHRTYVDTDLLVPRSRFRAAGRLLRRAGYRRRVPGLVWRQTHAETWMRHRDGAQVDLHHMLGLMDAAIDPWPVLVHHSEPIVVGGVTLAGLDEPARCLHVALHAAQSPVGSRASEDLDRAAAVVSLEVWEIAAALARRLRCEGEMAAGLATVPAGAALADQLGVTGRRSSKVAALRASGSTRTMGHLRSQGTWRGRVAVVVAAVVPGRRWLQRQFPWARGPLVAVAFVVDVVGKSARLGWGLVRLLAGPRTKSEVHHP